MTLTGLNVLSLAKDTKIVHNFTLTSSWNLQKLVVAKRALIGKTTEVTLQTEISKCLCLGGCTRVLIGKIQVSQED